jgi:hypothetical protein
MGLLMSFYIQCERKRLFGSTVEEKQEIGGASFINQACLLYERLLGMSGVLQVQQKLRRSKFSQMEEWCPQFRQVLLV